MVGFEPESYYLYATQDLMNLLKINELHWHWLTTVLHVRDVKAVEHASALFKAQLPPSIVIFWTQLFPFQ